MKLFETRSTRYNSGSKVLTDLDCEIDLSRDQLGTTVVSRLLWWVLYKSRPSRYDVDSEIYMWRWNYFETRSSRYNRGSKVLTELECEIILKRDQLGAIVVLRILWWKPFETRLTRSNSGSTILIDLDYKINLKRDQLGKRVDSWSC